MMSVVLRAKGPPTHKTIKWKEIQPFISTIHLFLTMNKAEKFFFVFFFYCSLSHGLRKNSCTHLHTAKIS